MNMTRFFCLLFYGKAPAPARGAPTAAAAPPSPWINIPDVWHRKINYLVVAILSRQRQRRRLRRCPGPWKLDTLDTEHWLDAVRWATYRPRVGAHVARTGRSARWPDGTRLATSSAGPPFALFAFVGLPWWRCGEVGEKNRTETRTKDGN